MFFLIFLLIGTLTAMAGAYAIALPCMIMVAGLGLASCFR